MKYQFTFYDPNNHYKPISTIITAKPHEKFSSMKDRAVKAVCAKRYWSVNDMVNFGYTKMRFRKVVEAEKNA